MTHDVAAVSVVVPTVGRVDLLRACLESLVACRPRAGEILVVDQSQVPATAELVRDFAAVGARVVPSAGRGVARSRNDGLAVARHDVVLVTDDDCTVDTTWVGVAFRLAAGDPECLFTGRVLPVGDPDAVPSTIDSLEPRSYRFGVDFSVLFGNNMVLPRRRVLALGGFDERIVPAGEDNDFCYRWLKAGLAMRYEPDLVVWHHDWRTREELERLYVDYAIGDGVFFAKHLRQGDWGMLRIVGMVVRLGLRGLAARVVRGRPRWSDWRQGVLRGLPVGLVRGWRTFGAKASR